jgi:hypothetical protein
MIAGESMRGGERVIDVIAPPSLGPPPRAAPALTSASIDALMAGLVRSGLLRGAPTPLSAVLEPERVLGALRADAALAASLLEHLPETARTAAGLEAAVRSPQLRQAAGALTTALGDPANAMAICEDRAVWRRARVAWRR